jgi:Ni,Fe-hydrogenase III component G
MAVSILDQLWQIYEKYETYIPKRISKEVFFTYTQKLIDQGNILLACDGERVVGYVEVWRLNFEQFGRVVCGVDVVADTEDVISGKLAYVANVWIDEEYREGFGLKKPVSVVKYLRRKYYIFTRGCEYHCGTANRKAGGLIKVFNTKKIGKHYGIC